MKELVIAEKPSVARDIARVLGCKKQTRNYIEGDSYVVTWGLGHLVTLADPEGYDKKLATWRMEDLPMMPERLKLVVIPKTRGQFQAVKTQIARKDISDIIIATDAGREGELVARWILIKAGNKKPLKRLWISSVTDRAIRQGFDHLADAGKYDNLFRAAVARAEADWLVGINATRALTCKYNAQLSCGRVQTPTLAMIARREEEIRHFTPAAYYGLTASVKGLSFTWKESGSGSSSVFSKQSRDRAMSQAAAGTAKITEVRRTKKTTYPEGLYDLTTLQRDANQRYGFSAKKTLDIMQRLYEHHKILTYPRTDSGYLTEDVAETLKERLVAINAGPWRPFVRTILKGKIRTRKSFVDNKKVSDHHAIIPTEQPVIPSALSVEENKIFDLVVRRFLAVLYPPFEYEETKVTIECGGQTFVSKVNVTLNAGFKEVLKGEEEEHGGNLSGLNLNPGDVLGSPRLTATEGKTKPPARFTEGTLLAAMENPVRYMTDKDAAAARTLKETGGLGTVATRADIIDKLFSSYLIEKKEEAIYLTGKARQLLDLVPEDLKKPELTADWETKLADIAGGKLRQDTFMKEIRHYTEELTNEIRGGSGTFRHDNLTNKLCPVCGKRMLSVNGKQGKLLVCQDRECGHKERISRLTNARCPVCHKKMELVGQGDKQKFVCVCGHKEALSAFQARRKKEGAGVSKKDVANYMKKMKKEEQEPLNSGLAEALANLKL
ncbi:MAG: DNA topoisomerase III [Eubacterium sp.]|nr:DNA topoisomerase III [Eubacterium sp.]